MKRENLGKVLNLIEEAKKIEYVLDRINNSNPDFIDRKWDWVPSYINSDYVKPILLNLTDDEEKCLNELKGAMTIILKNAAERTLSDINNEIEVM